MLKYKLVRPSLNGRRSPRWYVYWSENGRSHRRSTGCEDLASAERWLARFIDHRTRPINQVTINRIIDGHLIDLERRNASSLKHIISHLGFWKRSVGNLDWDQLSSEIVESQYEAWRKSGTSDGTIRTRALHLRAAYALAVKRTWIERAPHIDAPGGGEPRTRFLTRAEFEALYASAEELHIRTFLALGVWTGLRNGAILSLTWDNIDKERMMVLPGRGTENKRRAKVPINQALALALGMAWEYQEGPYVIQWRGKKVGSVKTGFHSARRRAGLEDIVIHDLRRTCASWLAIAGVPIDRIAMILGDSVAVVQKHYAHLAPDYLRDEMDALL